MRNHESVEWPTLSWWAYCILAEFSCANSHVDSNDTNGANGGNFNDILL